MKKIILLFILLSSFTFAKDYTQYCTPDNIQKSFGGNLMSLTGLNSLSRNIIEYQIEKALKKETDSKFKVKVNNFYGNNILGGEFKSLSASAKEYKDKNIYLSDLKIETVCPYNKVSYENDELLFDENMVLKFSAKMTKDDLNKTLELGQYKKILEKMNQDETISSLIKIEDSEIDIKNNKLLFKYRVLPLPKHDLIFLSKKISKPVDFVFGANLEVKDGKIQVCDFALNSKNTSYGAFLPLINKLNPTSWETEIDKNNKGKLEFENVKIENNEIIFDGYLLVEKTNG